MKFSFIIVHEVWVGYVYMYIYIFNINIYIYILACCYKRETLETINKMVTIGSIDFLLEASHDVWQVGFFLGGSRGDGVRIKHNDAYMIL